MAQLTTTSGQIVEVDEATASIPGMQYEGATVVDTPAQVEVTQPAVDQVSPSPTSTVVPENVLAPTPITEGQTFNKEKIGEDITGTLATAGVMDKTANRAFFDAATRYAEARNATAEELASGMTVNQVMEAYGLGDLAPTHGIATEEPGEGVAGDAPAEEPTTGDPVIDAMNKAIAERTASLGETVDMVEYNRIKDERALAVEESRLAIANKNFIDAAILDQIGVNEPMSMADALGSKAKYSREEYIGNLAMVQDYNTKLVLSNMANGQFLEAQRINQQVASDVQDLQLLQIDLAREQGRIDDREADRLEREADIQREMSMEGYLYISDPKMLEGLTEDEIYRDPVNGRIYKKPVAQDSVLSISDAKALGVPFGTTTSEAIAMGINPAAIAAPGSDPLDELLSPNELSLFNAPAGSTMRDVMGLIPKTELTGIQKFTQEIKLGKEFESLVGDSRSAATAVHNINASLAIAEEAVKEGETLNAASQGILVAFQKLLDPQSVVRESEYARSGNGQSLWDRMKGTWQKLEQGGAGVTIEGLRDFTRTANTFLDGYSNSALKHAKRMEVIAGRQGLDLGSILTEDMIGLLTDDRPASYTDVQSWLDTEPANEDLITNTIREQNLNQDEALQLINRIQERSSFSNVGSDTNQATFDKVATKDEGDKGGQCGRFVNDITDLGVGDSFQSKMAKMDPTITTPAPGMVFTMPYKDTGHCGFIVDVEGDNAIVKDSNWSLDEKVKTHTIPLSKITGLANV